MVAVSQLFGTETPDTFDCEVRCAARTAYAAIEVHDYHFHGPQQSEFVPLHGFLDLALSRRPGKPRGRYLDAPASAARAMGDIIFVPAGARLRSEWGGGTQSSVCLSFEGRSDIDRPRWTEAELDASLDVRSPFVRDALLRLARELEQPGFESTLMIEALSLQLGVELGRYFRATRPAEDMLAGRLSAAQLRRIEERVEAAGPLPSVADLALECGISARHFFRMFRTTTGMTLSDYAAERRIARARALLASERIPIKQVSWHCGFETAAAFSAAFRRATGFRPREYRKLLAN